MLERIKVLLFTFIWNFKISNTTNSTLITIIILYYQKNVTSNHSPHELYGGGTPIGIHMHTRVNMFEDHQHDDLWTDA